MATEPIEEFLPALGTALSQISGYNITHSQIAEVSELTRKTVSACAGKNLTTSVKTYQTFCNAVSAIVVERRALIKKHQSKNGA